MNKESGRPPRDRFDMLVQALFVGAVKDGQFNTVHSLLGAGADPRNSLAVCEAAGRGHLEILRLLRHAGADLRRDNNSALSAASYNGHADVVREMLDAGCDYSVHNHGPLR